MVVWPQPRVVPVSFPQMTGDLVLPLLVGLQGPSGKGALGCSCCRCSPAWGLFQHLRTAHVSSQKWFCFYVSSGPHIPHVSLSLKLVSKLRASSAGSSRTPPHPPCCSCDSRWLTGYLGNVYIAFLGLLLYSQYYKFVLSFVTCSILGAVVFVLCCVE